MIVSQYVFWCNFQWYVKNAFQNFFFFHLPSCEGVKPARFLLNSFAPEATRYLAIPVCELWKAVWSGVFPIRSLKSRSAPAWMSNWVNLGHHPIYLVKKGSNAPAKEFVFNLQLWQVTVLHFQPLEQWWWKVAHFKAPSHIYLKNNSIAALLWYIL